MSPKLVFTAFLLALSPASAEAGSCYVDFTGLAFGDISGIEKRASGTITLACRGVEAAGYTILLGAGRSGTYGPRTLTSGQAVLRYNLYTDAAYTRVWGDGSAGTTAVSGVLQPGPSGQASASFRVYGRLPAQTRLTPGSYADSLIVTVVY